MRKFAARLLAATICLTPLAGLAANTGADSAPKPGTVLPYPDPPFSGHIGRTVPQSTPAFKPQVTAPKGAPNMLVIMTDDVGFAASSTFGGPVPTPNLDALASQGLRYNRFHTTAMCSPTRSALLTGRNHHAVGNGTVADMTTGYPGYSNEIPRSAATVAQVLRMNGFSTAMIGKDHNVPYSQISAAGPFDQWPSGKGFDYFYGFLGGDTNQWNPKLYRNNSPIVGDEGKPNELLDKKLADEAIGWIHNQKAAAPGKPFFLYYAPGTAHAPHQAPKEWIAKFKGQFDQGWDAAREQIFARQKAAGIVPANAQLTPRPDLIPAWDSLSPDQKRANARMMEVFAAMLSYEDAQIGRVIDELRRMGELDNTLVVFIEGDNGASGEGGPTGTMNELGAMANGVRDTPETLAASMEQMGGPKSYELYPVGWAWATDTPFQWTKQIASHLGGTRNGLVVSWPAGIKQKGGIRSQFSHVTDIAPTLLDVAGVVQPEIVNGVKQQPVDGVSLRYTFDDATAAERHATQYFEMVGNRSIYHDGWMASTTPIRGPWQMFPEPKEDAETGYHWELYDLNNDFSQSHDLAAQYPEKLKALQDLWWKEAERNQVLPVDNRNGPSRAEEGRRGLAPPRNSFTYWGKDISVAVLAAPSFAMRSFSITADVVVPKQGSGVVLAVGSWFGGWSFYLDKGRPVAFEALSQRPGQQYKVEAPAAIAAGPAQVRFDFDYDGGGFGKGGLMRISVDGKEVARGRMERTILVPAGLGESLDIGFDSGAPVTDAYLGHDAFNGEISKVQVDLR